ncbi:DUF4393 domain-containing protein [Lysinibacillus sp. NPDC093712]|uniref:DUF4393 domain-containing protein n=1 Tax=Lysinibacillus sp. NPDC093712 TaxID=3390579 RepID=UPI003D023479
MSEENSFFKDISQSIKVPADVTKAVLLPPAQQIGKGLEDIFYLVFAPLAKKRARAEQNIEDFKREIAVEVAKIDNDDIVEPKLAVVGPALESSKYYIEEETIRVMFAKLIAASVNKEYANSTVPAFVEIIKQLSSFDAQIFNTLFKEQIRDKSTSPKIGAGRIRVQNKTGGKNIVETFYPFPELNIKNLNQYSASLDNLVRLGLIKLTHGVAYTNKECYEKLYNHNLLNELKKKQDLKNIERIKKGLRPSEIIFVESIWKVTTFGMEFGKCCLK